MTRWVVGLTKAGCGAYLHVLGWLAVYAVLAALVFGWKPIMITGHSMGPAIDAGDLVLVERDLHHPVAEGAVITYRASHGGLVTHRVVEVLPDGYRTRGDANHTPDHEVVPRAAVEGAGRLLVPWLGRPVHWLREGAPERAAVWLAATLGAVVAAPRQLPLPRTPARPEVRRLVGGQLVPVRGTGSAGGPPVPRPATPRPLPPHLRVYRAPRLVWA